LAFAHWPGAEIFANASIFAYVPSEQFRYPIFVVYSFTVVAATAADCCHECVSGSADNEAEYDGAEDCALER